MKYIQIIGVGLTFILMCKIASTPINQYISTNKYKIDVEPEKELIFTPHPVTDQLVISKYPEIQTFLDNLPDCNWCIACGSYARYTRLEAEKEGLWFGEITVKDDDPGRIKRTVMSGHRLNYFNASDGHRVYIDNMYNWGIILEGYELKNHIKSKFNIDLNRITFST